MTDGARDMPAPGNAARRVGRDTALAHAGRAPFEHHGVVNTPVHRASTILFPTLDALEGRDPAIRYRYGRRGTPTATALEEAVRALEGAAGAVVAPSGMAAVAAALMANLSAGDHALIVDSVYAPTRDFADTALRRWGVSVDYYDPAIGADIAGLIRPNTRVIMMESPGSLTFEVQDIPAIAAAARARGVTTIVDNTWAAGYFLRPLEMGVDISVQAATKYMCGHADVMLGVIACGESTLPAVRRFAGDMGLCAGPDDMYMAQRGLRTLGARLRQHMAGGLAVARWLQARPEVARVMHPALPGDPGHALWKRDFTGACGLFGFVMRDCSRRALAAMMDGMRLFGMGYSWGGYESLLIPVYPAKSRHIPHRRPHPTPGRMMRVHVGLEDPDDLIADLTDGFDRLRRADA